MNKILADKYTEMFRQSFGNVIHEENIIINRSLVQQHVCIMRMGF